MAETLITDGCYVAQAVTQQCRGCGCEMLRVCCVRIGATIPAADWDVCSDCAKDAANADAPSRLDRCMFYLMGGLSLCGWYVMGRMAWEHFVAQ